MSNRTQHYYEVLDEALNAAVANVEKILTNAPGIFQDAQFDAASRVAKRLSMWRQRGANGNIAVGVKRVDIEESIGAVLLATVMHLHRTVDVQESLMAALGNSFKTKMAYSLVTGSFCALREGTHEVFDGLRKGALFADASDSAAALRRPLSNAALAQRDIAEDVGCCCALMLSWVTLRRARGENTLSSPLFAPVADRLATLGEALPSQASLPVSASSRKSCVSSTLETASNAIPLTESTYSTRTSTMTIPQPMVRQQRRESKLPTEIRTFKEDDSDDETCILAATDVMGLFSSWDCGTSSEKTLKSDAETPQYKPSTVASPAVTSQGPSRMPNAATPDLAARSQRCAQLRLGILDPPRAPLSAERKRLLDQTSTLREALTQIGVEDYNIVLFHLRTYARTIGDSGPLLWIASLDVALPKVGCSAEAVPLDKLWREEQNEQAKLPDTETVTWVEVMRSEPCVRGNVARLHAVVMAARALMPIEMEYYLSLKKEDCVEVEDSAMEATSTKLADGSRRIHFNTFQLDGTSFVAQAFQHLQANDSLGRPLTWKIIENRDGDSRYTIHGQPDAYVVRIYRGDGSVLLEHCSNEIPGTLVPDWTGNQGESTKLRRVSVLIPTVNAALFRAAELLGKKDSYALLKASFDRLQHPVVNEAREYVLNMLSLFFGMQHSTGNSAKEVIRLDDVQLSGAWSSTVSVRVSEDPLRPDENVQWVTLDSVPAANKKEARRDSLLSIGKSNFTTEVLRMVEYGTPAQKGHAETILLANAAAVLVPAASWLDAVATELPPSENTCIPARAYGAVDEYAVKADASHTQLEMDHCTKVIASVIMKTLPRATAEMEMWLRQVYAGFRGEVKWDTAVLNLFRKTLPHGTFCFGTYHVYTMDPFLNLREHTQMTGLGPLSAVHKTFRTIKDTLDKAPLPTRLRFKEAKTF